MSLVPERLAKFEERVQREVNDGLLPAVQYAVGFEGEIVASGTFGDANDDTRFVLFSATKALVASTVWTCIAEGSIKIDSLVADMIPEFATNGKEDITIEQVMLHTSGFPRNGFGRRDGDLRRPPRTLRELEDQLGARHSRTSTTRPRPTGCWPNSSKWRRARTTSTSSPSE